MNREASAVNSELLGWTIAGYRPKHQAPEPDYALLERQAREADDYRYGQMTVQFIAEYAAERGPLQSDITPWARQDFVESQRRTAANAIMRQNLAQLYADIKRARIDLGLYGDGKVYIGRHRATEESKPQFVETAKGPAEDYADEVPSAGRLKTAWYAASAAINAWFARPGKGRRHRICP